MVSKIETKTISFENMMKLFKKYVAKSESRPVLEHVYFDGESFRATNTHVLLKVNAEYVSDIPQGYPETFLYDPKTMTLNESNMNYPETSRIIPNYSEATITLNNKNIKELQDVLKESKKIAKNHKNKNIHMEFNSTGAIIKAEYIDKDKTKEEYRSTIDNLLADGKEIKLDANVQYMQDALVVAKKLSKLNGESTQINLISNMRPIVFSQKDIFELLVMPVRIK